MLSKILRTIMGLPFILAIWPILIVFVILIRVPVWIFSGSFLPEGECELACDDRDSIIILLTAPYQFLMQIWKASISGKEEV